MTAPTDPRQDYGDHGEWDALAVGWALSALEQDDEASFAVHLPGCERCTQTVRESLRTVGDLAYAVPDEAPPSSLKTRIMAAVALEPRRALPPAGPAEPDDAPAGEGEWPLGTRGGLDPRVPSGPAEPGVPDWFERPGQPPGPSTGHPTPGDGPPGDWDDHPDDRYDQPGGGARGLPGAPEWPAGPGGVVGWPEDSAGRPGEVGGRPGGVAGWPEDAAGRRGEVGGRPGGVGGWPGGPAGWPGDAGRPGELGGRPGELGGRPGGVGGWPGGPVGWPGDAAERPGGAGGQRGDVVGRPDTGDRPPAGAAGPGEPTGPADRRFAAPPGPIGSRRPMAGAGRHAAPDDGTDASSAVVPMRLRRPRWLPVVAAAAAVLLIVTLGLWNLRLRSEQNDLRQIVAQRERAIEQLTADGPARIAALNDPQVKAAPRRATVVVRGDRVEVITETLQVSDRDVTYWLWTLGCDLTNLKPIRGFQVPRSQFSVNSIGSDPGFARAPCFAVSQEVGPATPKAPRKVVAVGAAK